MARTLRWANGSLMEPLTRRAFLTTILTFGCFYLGFCRPSQNSSNRDPRALIRPLSCYYNKTGETGICMFALNCYKAKGTPLTTCKDGIFLGSCCRLPQSEDLAETVSELPGNDLSPSPPAGISSWEWTYYPPTPRNTAKPGLTHASVVTSVVTRIDSFTAKPDTTITNGHRGTTTPPSRSSPTQPSMSDSELLSEIVDMLQSNNESFDTSQINNRISATYPTTWIASDIPPVSTVVTRNPVTMSRPQATTTAVPVDWEIISETTKNLTATKTEAASSTTSFKRPIYQTPPSRPIIPTTPKIRPIPLFTLNTTPQPQIPPHKTTPTSSIVTPTTDRSNHVPTSTEFDLSKADFKEACGRRFYNKNAPSSRMVGATPSEFGKWPWQVSLRQWKKNTFQHKCGAALLNENWAITAAHCVDNVPVEHLQVRIGDFNVNEVNEPLTHVDRQVQIIAKHPDFNPRNFENDLALVRFYEPITFQENIVPICIPQNDNSFVNSSAYVTGWGRLYEDGPLPDQLYEAQIPIISNLECEKLYRRAGYIESIPDIFICAGRPEGGVDSCEGDSGGPMVIRGADRRWILAGIISWGIGCAEPNQPGVYTRVSRFRDWINAILVF